MRQRKLRNTPTVRRATEVDLHVGQRMRLRRMLLGISQEHLARTLGLTFQQVQKYENGTNRISVSRLFQLSKVLGVSIPWFFEELPEHGAKARIAGSSPAPAANDESEDLINKRETLELVRVYSAIKNPGVRRTLRSMADALANMK
jgi:transcriptional regulator with XRE-family HTH domain